MLNGENDINVTWQRRRDMALESLTKALKMDPDDSNSLLLLAKLHLLPGGDPTVGEECARRVVEQFRDNPVRLSEALVVRARYAENAEERLQALDQAVAADDENRDALRIRAQARLLNGNVEGAIEDLTGLANLDPDDIETMEQIVRAFASQDKFDKALIYVEKAIKIDPKSPTGYMLRSSIHMMQQKTDAALEDLDEAVQRAPDNHAVLLARAQLHELAEHYDRALADVNRALELRPGMLQGLLLRADIAVADGRPADAIVDMKKLLSLDPDNARVMLHLAAIYQSDQRPRKAIETYGKLVESDDDGIRALALRGRGDAYLGIGKHAEAIKDFEKGLQLAPDDDGLLNNLAWVLSTSPGDSLRDGKKSLDYAKQACELTEYSQSHILSTLAAAYAELGQWDEAVKWSEKSIEVDEGQVVDQLKTELENYKQKKPTREKQEQVENPKPEPELDIDEDLIVHEDNRQDGNQDEAKASDSTNNL